MHGRDEGAVGYCANKFAVTSDGYFEGYAAYFGDDDSYGDVFMEGAFDEMLEERGPEGIRMLYQHDPERPIGRWDSIKPDTLGLRVRGQLALESEDGKDVHALLENGAIAGLSVGYVELEAHDEDGVRLVTKVDLREISLVTFPAAERAIVGDKELGMKITDKGLTLDAPRKTSDGYLVCSARVARTGIQIYSGDECGRPSMERVRVYRPESEVFSKATLGSFAHRPVTVDHPNDAVTSHNWRDHSVGHIADEIARDGEFVRVPLVLMDAAAIKAVEAGKRELSMGYTCDLKWEPGKTADGQEYDAIQTRIRGNHLAIVGMARGGSSLRIGDENSLLGELEIFAEIIGGIKKDGHAFRRLTAIRDSSEAANCKEVFDEASRLLNMVKDAAKETDMNLTKITVDGLEVEVTDMAAKVVNRHLEKAEAELATLRAKVKAEEDAKAELAKAKDEADAKLAAKDVEISDLKKKLDDSAITPDKLQGMVAARHALVAKASAVLGDKLVVDGKTDLEIQRQVVDARMGDSAKDWNETKVAAGFDAITADVKVENGQGTVATDGRGKGIRDLALALGSAAAAGNSNAADKAHEEMCKDMQDAWKHPKAA